MPRVRGGLPLTLYRPAVTRTPPLPYDIPDLSARPIQTNTVMGAVLACVAQQTDTDFVVSVPYIADACRPVPHAMVVRAVRALRKLGLIIRYREGIGTYYYVPRH